MMQSVYANFTTTDNGGIGGGGAAPAAPSAASSCGDTKACAHAILNNPNITFQANGTQDLTKTQNGEPITDCGINGPLNTTLLNVILKIAAKYPIKLNYFTYNHGCSGFHKSGRAVDIDEPGMTPAKVSDIATMLPDGGGIGQQQCSYTQGAVVPEPRLRFFVDTPCDHLHVDVGASAP
jgi:hypothetical protein